MADYHLANTCPWSLPSPFRTLETACTAKSTFAPRRAESRHRRRDRSGCVRKALGPNRLRTAKPAPRFRETIVEGRPIRRERCRIWRARPGWVDGTATRVAADPAYGKITTGK